MRLADFIRSNINAIAAQWENFAKTRTPASGPLDTHALRDHVEEMLQTIVADMDAYQDAAEGKAKSRGEKPPEGSSDSAAQTHAAERVDQGFTGDQIVAEFRALRASVVALWRKQSPQMDADDVYDLTRFDEAVDQALEESLTRYTQRVERSRQIFLGMLGHDLRNPLSAITSGAQLMQRAGKLNERDSFLASQIETSATRIARLVNDLLELTAVQAGGRIRINPGPADLNEICRKVLAETKMGNPEQRLTLDAEGETTGEWDAARLEQVVSNLVGNAIQHGESESPVDVRVEGRGAEVVLRVHNDGPLIPAATMKKIFDAFAQGHRDRAGASTSVGLGLFIAREIITAHGGAIEVRSRPHEGTTFTARIPRAPVQTRARE